MKFLFLVFGTSVCLALANAQSFEEYSDDIERNARIGSIPSANQLKKIIEDLRDKLHDKYNHIVLNGSISLDLEKLGIQLDASAEGTISGLLDFEILKMGDRFYNYTFTIQFPNTITVELDSYSINGMIQGIPVFGNGNLSVAIVKPTLEGYFKVNPKKALIITIVSMAVNLQVEDFSFEVTGWMNDEIRSTIITRLINENFKNILEEYKEEIGALIGNLIVSLDLAIPINI